MQPESRGVQARNYRAAVRVSGTSQECPAINSPLTGMSRHQFTIDRRKAIEPGLCGVEQVEETYRQIRYALVDIVDGRYGQ